MVEQPVTDSGAAVRELRNQAGVTLRGLAAGIGVSVGTMSAIENGKVGLTVDRLRQIAQCLDVPVARFLEPPQPEKVETTADPTDWRVFAPLTLDPVLESAIDVFEELGYHGATMRLIAAGADISVAGIYHHYPSKQHLLVALVNIAHADLAQRLDAAGDGVDAVTAFANMVEALTLFHVERRALALVLAAELRRLEEPNRTHLQASMAQIEGRLLDTARRAAELGAFRSGDLSVATKAIVTMCLAVPTWTDDSDAAQGRRIAREYAELALAMVRHRVDH
ncbi:TetR family transcriptional regulator [Gordonia alkanivorans]|nr:TetR family transcriptional regulator [Gordonia alkanivorans]MDH3008589.1 TetR family transcriptional regulator [Gordonia alkanivorans]MDH3013406.1 TetR family transcriptional regulator [Gordonia alkanivorans]MDH3050985.1 TetR family transcriptional regulator [Gordonia alkanivorans]MDJ0028655.1 TetR family transcriptional regulator [Gordonia alkanivorans]